MSYGQGPDAGVPALRAGIISSPPASPRRLGGSVVFKTDDATVGQNPIQSIGEKTFYWKNDRWRDADVTAEGEKNPIRIKPFSDAYFALAARDNGRFAKYLALDGPVLIVLEGKTYFITKDEG